MKYSSIQPADTLIIRGAVPFIYAIKNNILPTRIGCEGNTILLFFCVI